MGRARPRDHRLLSNASRGPVQAFADEVHRLAKLLGDDRALATLSARLDDLDVSLSVDVDQIQQLIAARRAELQAGAFEIGHRVYSEEPKAFARGLGGDLAAAR